MITHIFIPNRKGILKKKGFPVKKSPGKGPKGALLKRLTLKPAPARPVGDARAMIAQKTRAKITDARVLLAKKQRQVTKPGLIQAGGLKTRKNRMKHVIEVEDEDELMDEEMDFQGPVPVLRRTVKNNYVLPRTLATMPPLPTFSRTIESDPFDCYQPYERRPPMYNAEPIPVHEDLYNPPRKGILRASLSSEALLKRTVSTALRSRLYSKPDPRTPSGIFGRDRDPDNEYNRPAPPPDTFSSIAGYRIVVSNLHSSVSQSDIQELFEDIGPLVESRLVRPGVAEVIYKRLDDAESAVDTYHNRQLDGQPMKCLLVRPRNMSFKQTAPRQHAANRMPLDLDTVHKVLFKR